MFKNGMRVQCHMLFTKMNFDLAKSSDDDILRTFLTFYSYKKKRE